MQNIWSSQWVCVSIFWIVFLKHSPYLDVPFDRTINVLLSLWSTKKNDVVSIWWWRRSLWHFSIFFSWNKGNLLHLEESRLIGIKWCWYQKCFKSRTQLLLEWWSTKLLLSGWINHETAEVFCFQIITETCRDWKVHCWEYAQQILDIKIWWNIVDSAYK